MPLQLTKTKNYITDLKIFNETVTRISNPKLKTEVEKLIKEYKHQATLIDNEHATLEKGYPDPSKSRDFVSRLAEVRKRLYKIVNDLN